MEFKTLKISPKTAVLESVRAQTKLFRYVRDNNLESAKANLNHPIHGPIIKEYLRIIQYGNNKINELEQSTTLSTETIDMKAKYAKAMHDYLTDKEKSIGRKLDVSRLMSEVMKQKGDVDAVISDKEILNNLEDSFGDIREKMKGATMQLGEGSADKPELYITNKE